AALVAVYIVLGVLYESLAHPLTIISTLPSAGLGALLAPEISGAELSVIPFFGIILLVGLVQKNRIMMGDFRLHGGRRPRSPPATRNPRCVPGAIPADPHDDFGGDARRAASCHCHWPRFGAAAPPRHHHYRRSSGLAGAHSVHHTGHLPAARPAAPQVGRRQHFLHSPAYAAAAARGIIRRPDSGAARQSLRRAPAMNPSTPRARARSGSARRQRVLVGRQFCRSPGSTGVIPSIVPGSARFRRGPAVQDPRSLRRGSPNADSS